MKIIGSCLQFRESLEIILYLNILELWIINKVSRKLLLRKKLKLANLFFLFIIKFRLKTKIELNQNCTYFNPLEI